MAVQGGRTGMQADAQDTDNRGLWQVALGSALAVLAPLAGFLGGTVQGPPEAGADIDPLLAWLIAGLALGGAGVVIALLGGLRWHRAQRTTTSEAELRHARDTSAGAGL